MKVETKMTIEVEVTVRGAYKPGASPLPVPGEAVAVVCPGWEEHVEDFEVEFPGGGKWMPEYDADCEDLLAELENGLIEAAKVEVERSEEP